MLLKRIRVSAHRRGGITEKLLSKNTLNVIRKVMGRCSSLTMCDLYGAQQLSLMMDNEIKEKFKKQQNSEKRKIMII